MYGNHIEEKVRKQMYNIYGIKVQFGWDSLPSTIKKVKSQRETKYKFLFKSSSEHNPAITNLGVRCVYFKDIYDNTKREILTCLYYTPHDMVGEIVNHIEHKFPEVLL